MYALLRKLLYFVAEKALVENGKEKFQDLHKSILVIPTRILRLFQSMRLM